MKIERISDSTVKLILSDIDFEKRNIDAKTLQVDSPIYQQLLWDALEHAEIELGVHITAGRVRVEQSAKEDGRYEITVTNIPGVGGKDAPVSEEPSKEHTRQPIMIPSQLLAHLVKSGVVPTEELGESEELLRAARVSFPNAQGDGMACFSDFDEMYTFFHANRIFEALPSSLYQMEDAFYLLIHNSGRNRVLMDQLEVRLTDYNAMILPAEVFVPMLEEYGSVMFKRGAIRRILKAFGEE